MNPVGKTRKVLKGKFRQEVVEPREDDGSEFQLFRRCQAHLLPEIPCHGKGCAITLYFFNPVFDSGDGVGSPSVNVKQKVGLQTFPGIKNTFMCVWNIIKVQIRSKLDMMHL